MSDEQIIKAANTILSQLTVPQRVKAISDVNSDIFVTIYEGLCGESIPDLISPATSEEAQIHNVQCVIDSLALDVLHTSLAHINGQDIVSGRRMSIMNLLDIFSGLLEYILDGIAKEDQSDKDSQKDADEINQSVISDAVREALFSSGRPQTTATSDENTEELIALGDEKYLQSRSPTASPSNKKSRLSGGKGELRKSKRITPQAVCQPMASSSMQSIHPSGTESESDASVKPSTNRALAFSKVPAEFSPPENRKNVTFTKPDIPPEKTISQKLADEILKTGESTQELITLGETPAARPKRQSVTRSARKESGHQRGQPSKKSRVSKRHVSFISDRTATEDKGHVKTENAANDSVTHTLDKDSCNSSGLTAKLTEYFSQKETSPLAGDTNRMTYQLEDTLSDSSDYKTAVEKTRSLYNRVTALRNAAAEKLESLHSDSTCQYETGQSYPTTTGAAVYQSDYAKKKMVESTAGYNGNKERSADDYCTTKPLSWKADGADDISPLTSKRDKITDHREKDLLTYKTAVQSNVSVSNNTNTRTGISCTVPELPHPVTTSSSTTRQKVLPTSDGTVRSSSLHDPVKHTESDQLQFFVDDKHHDYIDTTNISTYKKPDWVSDEKEKHVRFTRSKAAHTNKSKSQSMFEAIKKTLDEEKWREKLQKKTLSKQYKDDLDEMMELHRERLDEERAQANKQDRLFLNNVQRLVEAYGEQKPKVIPSYQPKGYLLPKTKVIRKQSAHRSRSLSPSSKVPATSLDPNDNNFLPQLMEEFPHLYLAPETIKKMWTDHQKQTVTIKRCLEEDKRRNNKAKTTIEDAEKRQAILMNIMQKELEHTKRIKQMREKENAETENKRRARDVRTQSARVKKYYDDYAVRMKSSMLKNKTKEEQLFKKLFAEGLKVQKERMHALRAYAREQRENRAKQQQLDVEALENFYKDQFAMLADSVAQEKKNVEIRDAAQAKVLDKMKSELRKKMEEDIKNFQEQLKHDEDDYYFRQLDAEKVVQQLNMTRYQTGY